MTGPLLLAVALHTLPGQVTVTTPSPATATQLQGHGHRVVTATVDTVRDACAEAIVLLDDELSRAGEHAEGLVAEASRALRPGGLLLASAAGAVHAAAAGAPAGLRRFDAGGLARLLGHAGFAVEARYAPGAATGLAGAEPRFDPTLDRAPGLLDAAERVVALARRHRDPVDREATFLASLPRKVVAAAVVCLDGAGRLLVVHDTFKRHWTIPGGVVDADEDPRRAAGREAREETGLDVDVGRLLGVFTASWPDRLVLVYAATTTATTDARPVHTHEIDAVRWLPLDEALSILAPAIAEQVRCCLNEPGGTWRQ